MFSNTIQKLIDLFSKFPTIGPRTAARFVFYLLKLPKEEFNNLITSMEKARELSKTCSFCFDNFEGEENICQICFDPKRNKNILCVVEKEIDLQTLEKTKKYQGLYFILGGALSALKEKEIEKLKVKELEERIKNPSFFGVKTDGFKEIILALNPTPEGEATSLYLKRRLEPLGIKISRLGRGLPVGGELEYADEETLENAFEGRK